MSECTICFDTMNIYKDKLTQCYLCGNCVHTKCFTIWKRKAGTTSSNKCLYCQVESNLFRINRSCWEKFATCCCGD